MRWLKQTLLDLAVTLAILLHALAGIPGLEMPLLIYTLLVLAMKFIALWNFRLQRLLKKKSGAAPEWFYHLLYALNVIVLGAARQWALGLLWLGVWAISWLTTRKLQGRGTISAGKR